MKSIRRTAYLLGALLFGVTFGIDQGRSQVRSAMTLQRSDQMKAAKILKALSEDWALVDYADELDFLVLVSESREELGFYPKKKLVKQMEQAGLIENLDPK